MYFNKPFISLLSVILFVSCSDTDSLEPLLEVDGSVFLYNEYGDRLDNREGVQVEFELENELVTTQTDESGKYATSISSWEDVISISYSKDGFTSKKVVDLKEEPVLREVHMIELSTIEVYNLQAVALDQEGPFFEITFEAENFFHSNLDQVRFFNLLVYDNQGNFINSMRFRSFQQDEHWSEEFNDFEVLSSTRARITYKLMRVWFLREYAPNVDLEFRVYGATDFETYEHVYSLENEIDNSLNDTFSSAIVKTK